MTRRTTTKTKTPIAFLEDMALSNGWQFEGLGGTTFSMDLDDFPCPIHFLSRYDPHSQFFETRGVFDIVVPEKHQRDVFEILAALTLDVRMGCFTLCLQHMRPLFRHTLVGYPKNPITEQHMDDMMEEALAGGEKLFYALKFLIEERRTPQEAMFASLVDVMGEA